MLIGVDQPAVVFDHPVGGAPGIEGVAAGELVRSHEARQDPPRDDARPALAVELGDRLALEAQLVLHLHQRVVDPLQPLAGHPRGVGGEDEAGVVPPQVPRPHCPLPGVGDLGALDRARPGHARHQPGVEAPAPGRALPYEVGLDELERGGQQLGRLLLPGLPPLLPGVGLEGLALQGAQRRQQHIGGPRRPLLAADPVR